MKKSTLDQILKVIDYIVPRHNHLGHTVAKINQSGPETPGKKCTSWRTRR